MMFKLFELIGLEEFLGDVPFGINERKLDILDNIWRDITHDCGYEFIPTTKK